MNRAIFLDRDNTIIHNDGDLGDPERVRLVRGAAHVIASLRQLGFRIVVVTNQGGVARGRFDESDVDAVHARIATLVREASAAEIDRFYYCPYHPDGSVPEYAREHPWRKPSPGMLLQAARDLDLDLRECWLIGDAERDVEAGLAAGTKTVRVVPDPERTPSKAHFLVDTLAEAATIIARNRSRPAEPPPRIAIPAGVTAGERAAEPAAPVTSPPRPAVPSAATPKPTTPSAPEPQAEPETEPEPEPDTSGPDNPAEPESSDRGTADESDPIDRRGIFGAGPSDATSNAPATSTEATRGVSDSGATDIETDAETRPESATTPEPEADEVAAPPIRTAVPAEPMRRLAASREAVGAEPAEPGLPVGRTGSEAGREDRLLADLLGEVRSWRQSRREFTPRRMMLVIALLVVLVTGLALAIYIADPAAALVGVAAAVLVQITVIGFILVGERA